MATMELMSKPIIETDFLLKVPETKRFDVRVSVNHQQLKNLISTQPTGEPSDPVYFTNSYFIWSLYPHSGAIKQIGGMLKYKPLCLLGSCGYVVSGGPLNGQVDFWAPNGSHTFMELGGTYNNGVAIHRRNCDQKAESLVCNNDHTIKILNLDDKSLTNLLYFPVNMNHASVSNDGRFMVCVGDSPDVFIYDIDRSGSFHHQSTSRADTHEGSFCTSISADNRLIACASEDSTISIFDIRQLGRVLESRSCQRPSPFGSIRSCHFSPPNAGPLDLLLYSEGYNIVHLLDTRNFCEKTFSIQALESTTIGANVEVSGTCFSDDGSRLYVASPSCIYEWDIEKRNRLCFPSFDMA
ncbi:WD40/YVTN repeat-like protein [Schizosaccharomyces japonicus yFS275]|uniref:WD40/YVTN repeat-like protein n=1 Tax=Schizosaccharomyces japonicus (strain yFS275 / FY16936) TaxID=402676 RepID=B6K642_SCHJY|nr:WD40/YVTN repeat-like protein [Schizosaccharomyces japonicus yFS275]EEB08996.1 WD40/YVTN repeat-like protein [Schizosaccharomyces japonicus yFS275]